MSLLNHRRASFALRLLARPIGGGGQEEILKKRGSSLTAGIKERCGVGRRETAEVQTWEELREMRAEAIVDKKDEALRTAKEWSSHQGTIWTDGSRLENGAVGAALAFKEEDRWVRRGTYLGKNKEVFDAEVFAILQALNLLSGRDEQGQRYTVFSDSQAAIARAQHDRTGPAQALAKGAIRVVDSITSRDNTVTLRWTLAPAGVEGNERADETAKRAAEDREERAPLTYLGEASLAYLTRKTTEARSVAAAEWIRNHTSRRRRYRAPKGGRMRKALNRTRKELASRFYQLLSGHSAVAEHLTRANQAPYDRCWAELERGRLASTSLSSAEGGSQRSGGCGRG